MLLSSTLSPATPLRRFVRAATLLATLLAALSMAGQGFAQTGPATFTYLYHTSYTTEVPPSSLVQGSDGNFYGTTSDLSNNNDPGTVFRLTPAGVLTTLYAFTGGSDGSGPFGLVQGSDGNFYGATAILYNEATKITTYGTIFKITPAGALTTLHQFAIPRVDGAGAVALVQGSDGNLYGTTAVDGANGAGTVFQLTPTGGFATLYDFAADPNNSNTTGADPDGPLVQGSDGNLYGTTSRGGPDAAGTVFKITTTGVFTSLYQFKVSDSYYPLGLTQGSDGNFYGETGFSPASEYGSIFQVTPAGVLTTVHRFNVSDGAFLRGPLASGSDGNLYGSTFQGGANGDGTIFRLTTAGALTTLHDFDSFEFFAFTTSLFQGSDGDFYGTRSYNGAGAVFRISLKPSFFAGQVVLGDNFYFLQFPNGNRFGSYTFLSDPHYIYHATLGYEYVFQVGDASAGVYFYDFASSTFFYTSPTFPFPYLYDFSLNTVLYYYPDSINPRYFYRFDTGEVITK